MQISDMVGHYNQAVSSGAETLTGTKGVENLVASLRSLTKGNIFEGTVTSIKNGRVMLFLSGGQQVMARLDGKVPIAEGDSMFFQVKSNDGTQIAIRPFLIDGAGANYTLMQALSAAGLSAQPDYLSMVNHMMEEQMPIDRNSLQQMARLVNANPQINTQTLVQLQKLGIPISVENASQFENYRSDSQAITKEIDTFIEELPQTLQESAEQETMPAGNVRQLSSDLLQILTEGLEEVPYVEDGASFGQTLPETQTFPQEGAPDIAPEANGQMEQETTEVEVPAGAQNSAAETAELPETGQTAQNIQENPVPEPYQTPASPPVPHTLGAVLSKEQIQSLNQTIGQMLGTHTANYTKDSGVVEVLKDLQQVFKDPLPVESRQLGKLFSSKEFRALIKDTAEQQWMVKPQDLAKEDAVERLYERLDRQMEKIESALKNAGQEHTSFSQVTGEIRSNMEFMNQINQAYTYAQIPLKMSGQHASGELFVYTNKKALAQGDKDLTAFLHLDLDHLGSTDVSVGMNGREVTTKFYLENDFSYQLLEKNYPVLKARLEKKGYHCSISVINEEKHVNVVNDFLKMGQTSTGQLHRYSFDMRA